MSYLIYDPYPRSGKKKILYVALPLVILGILLFAMFNEKSNSEVSYYQNIVSAESYEYASPSQFLESDGKYHKTLLGPKYKIEGTIKNIATHAVYKDAVVEVFFYSKTKTKISNTLITIYEVFPPKSVKGFNLKVEAPIETESIGWNVIDASRK
jgi:hypothetical protein